MTEPETTRLEARGLTLGYGQGTIVDHVDLRLRPGLVTAIIGPNGCGKSTLLRGLSRLLTPSAGEVVLDGRPLHRLDRRHVARRVAILPQAPLVPDGVTVEELVGRARYPHRAWYQRRSAEDRRAVDDALADAELDDLRNRPVDELSGGQRQRAWVAMAMAQETPILLLDEPTTFLDLAHQVRLLDVVRRRNRERGTTVAMVLHDLHLAARYADHLVVMGGGQVRAEGDPTRVLTSGLLHRVFGLHARILTDPVSHTPLVVPTDGGHPQLLGALP